MDIGDFGRVWRRFVKRTPSVPKVSKVDGEGVASGEEHETRERNDYSGKKQGEAATTHVYGPDGETQELGEGDPPTLDVEG